MTKEIQEPLREQLTVIYDGAALSNHEMDAKILAAALEGIAALFTNTNETINGTRATLAVKVKAELKSGSVGINFELIQHITEQAVTFLSAKEVVAISTLASLLGFGVIDGAKGLFSLIKWIRGRKIKKTETLNANESRLILEDGDSALVLLQVLELYQDFSVRKSAKATLSPLEHEGIDSFAVEIQSVAVQKVTRSEIAYFALPEEKEEVNRFKQRIVLQPASISFTEGNKWRFYDGNSTILARISDDSFKTNIDSGTVVFGKNDVLTVDMETVQFISANAMKSEHEIIKVIEHKPGPVQMKLL